MGLAGLVRSPEVRLQLDVQHPHKAERPRRKNANIFVGLIGVLMAPPMKCSWRGLLGLYVLRDSGISPKADILLAAQLSENPY